MKNLLVSVATKPSIIVVVAAITLLSGVSGAAHAEEAKKLNPKQLQQQRPSAVRTKAAVKPVTGKTHAGSIQLQKGKLQAIKAGPEVEILEFSDANATDKKIRKEAAAIHGAKTDKKRPPRPRSTITVNKGDSITLKWSIRARNAKNVRGSIKVGDKTIKRVSPRQSKWQDGEDKWKKYTDQISIKVTEGGKYTLHVKGLPGGGVKSVAEKSVRVVMKAPKLEIVEPQVDPATRRVTFMMRNQGDSAANSRYLVRYQIKGRVDKTFPKLPGMPFLKKPKPVTVKGSLNTQPITVEPGKQIELGNITLPEAAWNNEALKMNISVKDKDHPAEFNASNKYDYKWPVKELNIGALHLIALNTLLKGEIRLHNYKNVSGNTTKHLPLAENASRVKMMDETSAFSINRARIKIVDKEHFFFIRDFTAPLGGDNFIFIENGKLGMRIEFECGDDRREIKGWTRDYINKRYVDSTTPDINIQHFNITVTLSPTLYKNKLSYRNVEVSVGSAVRFEGGWSWLNGLKGKMNKEIKSQVKKTLTKMLNDNKIKTALQDELTKSIMEMNPNIHHLISVHGKGEEIIIKYL